LDRTYGSLFVRNIVRKEHWVIEHHHRFVYENILTEDDWNLIDETLGINGRHNDYEMSAGAGVYYNWDDLYHIDVDRILESFDSYASDMKEWDDEWEQETYEADKIKEIVKKLESYRGYTLYYDYVPDEVKKVYGEEVDNPKAPDVKV